MAETTSQATVFVGIDYSEVSAPSVLAALQTAEDRAAELHIVHVLDGSSAVEGDASPASVTAHEEERLARFVEEQLREWGRSKGSRIVAIVTHVVSGHPAEALVQLATELSADLIVVGFQGRHGLERRILGSVAERIVRASPVPVMVVPATSEPDPAMQIAPPCPRCVESRRASGGATLWCEQHRERHGRRHTYHQLDRNAEARATNSLLISVRAF